MTLNTPLSQLTRFCTPRATLPCSVAAFSLIELMITFSIMLIVIFSAMPTLNAWQANSEAQRITRTVSHLLSVARQMAVAQGKTVSLCGSNKDGACRLRDFESLQIFIDTNKNKSRDAGEALLHHTHLSMGGKLRLNNHTSLRFTHDGTSRTPASFIYCPALPMPSLISRVTLSFTGRAYVAQKTPKNIITNASGSTITCRHWSG